MGLTTPTPQSTTLAQVGLDYAASFRDVVLYVTRLRTQPICSKYVCSVDHWTAGTGRTGYLHVAPNSYPFYSDDEKYIPIMQADGGQLSGKQQARPWPKFDMV